MTENEKWQAVKSCDARYDGRFYYAVKSTGVFCRPSCTSKSPLRENVVYFDSPQQAQTQGYRPCKRCRPELTAYEPMAEIANETKAVIERLYANKRALSGELRKLGVSSRRMEQIYKQQFGMTPLQYADTLRIQAAREQLRLPNSSVMDIAGSLGFESLTAFFAFFRKHTGITPGEYAQGGNPPAQADAHHAVYDTVFGPVTISEKGNAVVSVKLGSHMPCGAADCRTACTDRAALELNEYFAGQRSAFNVPIAMEGTHFQKRVWAALCEIPYGETRTYGQIAQAIGNPKASRAVGMANNKNPLMVMVPCHRVIGSNGQLSGYAGGVELKERLLKLERNGSAQTSAPENKKGVISDTSEQQSRMDEHVF